MKKFQPDMFNRGSVLFIVLVLAGAVSLTVIALFARQRSESAELELEKAKIQKFADCVSGMQIVINRMLTGQNNNLEWLDSKGASYSPPMYMDGSVTEIDLNEFFQINSVGPGRLQKENPRKIRIRIQDRAGLISFFRFPPEMLNRWLQHRGLSDSDAETTLDSLRDWVDADNLPRPRGREKSFYLSRNLPVPANRMPDSAAELIWLPGVTWPLLGEISRTFTFSPAMQMININSASREALMFFPGLSPETAEHIIRLRRVRKLTRADLFSKSMGYDFSGYSRLVGVSGSKIFYVKISSAIDENLDYYINSRMDMAGRALEMTDSDSVGSALLPLEAIQLSRVRRWEEGVEKRETDE